MSIIRMKNFGALFNLRFYIISVSNFPGRWAELHQAHSRIALKTRPSLRIEAALDADYSENIFRLWKLGIFIFLGEFDNFRREFIVNIITFYDLVNRTNFLATQTPK